MSSKKNKTKRRGGSQPVREAAAPDEPAATAAPPPAPPPLPASPERAEPASGDKEGFWEKVLLLAVEALVIGGIVFVFQQRYQDLQSLDDVKWDATAVECQDSECRTGRQTFYVYRIGKEPVKDVSVQFAVVEPKKYEIVDGTERQYEKSVLNHVFAPKGADEPDGARITYRVEDPELNNKTAYGYRVKSLSPQLVYEFTVTTKSKDGSKLEHYGVFEIRDAADHTYTHRGLSFNDYLRLYLVEFTVAAVVLSVLIVAVVGLLGWWIIKKRKAGR